MNARESEYSPTAPEVSAEQAQERDLESKDQSYRAPEQKSGIDRDIPSREPNNDERLDTLRKVLLRFPGRKKEQRTELEELEHELELNLSAGTDEELGDDLTAEKKRMSGWWYHFKMSLLSRVEQGSMFYKLHPYAVRRGQVGIDNMEAILEERVRLRKKIAELKGEEYEEVAA